MTRMDAGELERKLLGVRPEEVTNYILSEMDVDKASGRLTIFGSRVFLVRPELFVNVQKQLETTLGQSAKGIVYLAGERTGLDAAGFLGRATHVPDIRAQPELAFQRIADIWSCFGFGRITFLRFTRAPLSMDYRVENSALAGAYGKSAKPVCHLYAGAGSGLLRALFEEEVRSEEVRCAARGDPACDFQVRLVRAP